MERRKGDGEEWGERGRKNRSVEKVEALIANGIHHPGLLEK